MVRQYHLTPLQSDRLFRGGTELNIIWDICEISDKFISQFFPCAALFWKPHVGHYFNWFFWGELLITLKQQKLIPFQGYHWKRHVWHCNHENGATSFQRRGTCPDSEALVNLVKTEYKGDGFDWKWLNHDDCFSSRLPTQSRFFASSWPLLSSLMLPPSLRARFVKVFCLILMQKLCLILWKMLTFCSL